MVVPLVPDGFLNDVAEIGWGKHSAQQLRIISPSLSGRDPGTQGPKEGWISIGPLDLWLSAASGNVLHSYGKNNTMFNSMGI